MSHIMQNMDILNQSIQRLRELPPVKSIRVVEQAADSDREKENLIALKTKDGEKQLRFEIRGELKRPLPALLGMRKKDRAEPSIVFSRYVNPSIAEDLRKHDICFIDTVGNAYIHLDDFLFIDRQGRKPVVPDELKKSSVFHPKGMQLLFILLTRDNSLNETVRVLAQAAGVSKDRVSTGLRSLQQTGIVYRTGKGSWQFSDMRSLLEQWLAGYHMRFRSSLILGAYKIAPSCEANFPERLSELLPANRYAAGGALGADLLTHYYRGMTTEVYIHPEDLVNVKSTFKLIPARETNITLFRLFSPDVVFQDAGTAVSIAHPLLVYAELLHTGDDRAAETAQMIYNRYLKEQFDAA